MLTEKSNIRGCMKKGLFSVQCFMHSGSSHFSSFSSVLPIFLKSSHPDRSGQQLASHLFWPKEKQRWTISRSASLIPTPTIRCLNKVETQKLGWDAGQKQLEINSRTVDVFFYGIKMQGLQLQQEERLFNQNLKELEASRSLLIGIQIRDGHAPISADAHKMRIIRINRIKQ